MGPGAKAIRAEGGWRITGNWAFASGSRHATWLGAHCPCFEADGTPQRYPDGRARERTMLFRRESRPSRISGRWWVCAARAATTIRCSDLFVDDAHTMTRDSPEERREPGLIYQLRRDADLCVGLRCGCAGCRTCGAGLFHRACPWQDAGADADRAARQHGDPVSHRYRRREAERRPHLAAGTCCAMRRTRRLAAGEVPTEQRVKIRQASTFAIHQAKEVVDTAYHEAGSTAIFDSQPVRTPLPRREYGDAAGPGPSRAFRNDRPVYTGRKCQSAVVVK